MLDWRALRPGADHFAYSVSKAALASMTKSLALVLAPDIAVNAIALGAILPPENENPDPTILQKVPLKRWAQLSELENLIIYMLYSPPSLTGQIIHLDGGRHLIH
jgi:pteridine reductase